MVERPTRQGRPARFDFVVRVRDDAGPEVIDNPTVTWDVPTFHVATLAIPSQQFASPEQMRFCKALAFTPWHALPEHRPLGEINAVRREWSQQAPNTSASAASPSADPRNRSTRE